MSWIIGVDVGGTFTDFCARNNNTGETIIHKRPSTPNDPAIAILKGINELTEKFSYKKQKILRLAHGTTVATNSLLQRKGGKLALITTKGFRDLLEIGRQVRPSVYDLQIDSPPPLIERSHRFEINERIDFNGNIIKQISKKDLFNLELQIKKLKKIDGIAICLLFAFLNPVNELKIKKILSKKFPNLPISLSSEVQPEFREYERFSTTTINAYLQPEVGKYMNNLKEGIFKIDPSIEVNIFQSSGGLTTVSSASNFPVRMALSGPAAGVVGASETTRKSKFKDIITLDMGGTSTDVCLIQNGKAELSNLRDISGFRIRLPMIDINTVGAGGGSIAYVENDGLLKVGPISAGAVPGPACYNLGGLRPTVSDANLILGRLPETLVGGGMTLNKKNSVNSIKTISKKLKLTIEEAALGIIGIVNSNMTRAIRGVSVERGHDPRLFSLMPFGGAGGLHAVDIARELSIKNILVPRSPGILCAEGLLLSNLQETFVKTCRTSLEENFNIVERSLKEIKERAIKWFKNEGKSDGKRSLLLFLDMRYVGQNYELSINLGDILNKKINLKKSDLKSLFFENHKKNYGHFDPYAEIEVVNLRLRAISELKSKQPKLKTLNDKPKFNSIVDVWFDNKKPRKTKVFERSTLTPDFTINEPSIIVQEDATTLIPPDCTLIVDNKLNLIIET
tara:strand:+ start:1346 stop:3385 length:2040 start_codon:yes stop_codon:yes gene_type:complete